MCRENPMRVPLFYQANAAAVRLCRVMTLMQ